MDDRLILDRYRLIERLAVGGSAEVWRARDEQLGREVAVKRLHPHLLPDEASRKRLVTEAQAAAALSHPVVVGIYDVDGSGEWPALVMELVDGESLAARIARDGPLPAAQAVAIVADVADALFHAHQRGVIHRDVKPGNVLLAVDGRTRLVDFGIAHSLAIGAERLTLAGTVIGTLHAMAPEQLAGGPITPRTDLYGLGVVLHEALTGRSPYPASSPVALADAQRAGPPVLSGLDPALEAVVRACLAHDPADRPLHAGALADALRDWLRGDSAAALAMASMPPVDAETVTRPIPPAAAVAPVAAAPVTAAPSPRAPPRRRLPAAIPAALAVLALLGLVAFVSGGPGGLLGEGDQGGATPSASPATATPMPERLAELAARVAEACGADAAAQFAAEAVGEEEKDQEKAAEELEKACREDTDEGGGNGGNGGNGRGNGNGGGNGRGDD